MKFNTKAIVTIPAWAEALHNGEGKERDTIDNAAAAYAFVPLVYRAIRLRADALANTPIHITKKGGETDVEWPFPDVDLKDLIWKTEASLCLSGANFIEKRLKKLSGKIGGMQWVNPTTMSVRLVDREDGTQFLQFQQGTKGDRKWTLDDMIYMREFSLRDDVGPGDSSAKVSLNDAALIRYMSRFAARFFETGAMPVTVLQIDGLVDPDEAKRIENFFKRAATRIRNAFNTLALNRVIEPKIISQPIKDLVMPELNEQARHAISLAFGIPQTMLEDAANYATSAEHRLSFWQDTMRPRGVWMEEQLNRQLFAPMGLEFHFGFDELDIFQEDENARATSLGALVNAINTDADIASWAMGVLGYDLTDEQQTKLDLIIKKKEQQAQQAREQIASNTSNAQDAQNATSTTPPPVRAAWMDDLHRWERKAIRVLSQSGTAVCEYTSDILPDDVRKEIEQGLPGCRDADAIRSLFLPHIKASVMTPAPQYEDEQENKALAESINRLADVYLKSINATTAPNMNFNFPPINVTANLPETKPSVTFAPIIQPSEVINQNNVSVDVQPTPIENNFNPSIDVQPTPIQNNVENNIEVKPADVNIPKPVLEQQKIKRNKQTGLIDETTTRIEYKE